MFVAKEFRYNNDLFSKEPITSVSQSLIHNVDIGLLPSGHLHCFPTANTNDTEIRTHTEIETTTLLEHFTRHSGEGLFSLAADKSVKGLRPTQRYWHDFTCSYLGARCQHIETGLGSQKPSPAEPDDATPTSYDHLSPKAAGQWLHSAPPMQGAEYLSIKVLQGIWQQLNEWVCEQTTIYGSFSALLNERAPQWHPVGRVCFHLAENKRDPDYPFAFMATYAPQQQTGQKIRYQPLRLALQEYADAHDRQLLIRLLSPVQRAAEASEMVADLIESGDIYHPLAWTPAEAYQFLQEIPAYEESGLVVRLPDWWRKKRQVQVGVRIGNSKTSHFGADALLDFQVQIALGDEPLSEAELAELLAAEEGLLFIKGQWVEVDPQRLGEALTHWQRVESEASQGGISFAEGMRMLAGAPTDMGRVDREDKLHEWSRIEAGEWLTTLLKQLQSPDTLEKLKQDKQLKATLRPYQQEGVNWLWLLSKLGLGACLADDMGLGKTIQIIALLLRIKQQSSVTPSTPSLLVLPASLLTNWQAELERFAPSLRPCFIHSSQLSPQQIDTLAAEDNGELNRFDLVLTTYATLMRREWLQQRQWHLLVLDEAQAIKNPSTRQTKIVKQIKANARIALTGTPIENSLVDLWSLFDFLNPGLLGSSSRFKSFAKSLADRSHDQYAPLRRLTQPYILRRLKTDKTIIADLPEKSEVNAYCGLSKRQALQYQKAVKDLSNALKNLEGIQRRGQVLASLQRFKQICNHPSQLLGDGLYQPQHSGKFQRLAELCEEIASRQEKLLLFTQFREMTDPLAHFLAQQFGRPGLVLHGGTPIKQRRQRVEAFQSEDGPPFFVLSLKAGGTGLTLTEASHVVHFDRWWNPAVENQATDRAFRIGQKRNVLVHKFICPGTIEEKIDAMIHEKSDLANDILQGGGEIPLTEMDDKALLSLVALDIEKTKIG